MAKAWGGAGAWAAEAELAEQEAKEREQLTYKAPGSVKEDAFPSLGDSLSSKPTKKKNKGVTLSLSEITVGKYVGPGGKTRGSYSESTKLTTEEMLMLPTGPRERTEDEAPSGGLGGGFKDYGGYRGGDRDRGGDREDRRGGFGGGYGGERDRDGGGYGRDDRSRDRDRERDDGPSRADTEDKWGATKKFVPSLPTDRGSDRGDRPRSADRGGYEEDRRSSRLSDRDLPSRADEVDNWGSSKKFVAAAPAPAPAGGGDGYHERRSSGGRYEERRSNMGGFDDHPGGSLISRADEVDNWGKTKKFVPASAPPNRGAGGGFDSTYKEAGADADRWARKEPLARDPEQPRVTERPRLKLAPRTVPLESTPPPPAVAETNGEGVTPAVGDLPVSEQQQAPAAKPKPRSNPFGAARPREEVLAEKGQDWRKIDAELEVPRERYGRPGSRPTSSHSSRQGGGMTSRPQTPGGVSSRPHTPDVGADKPRPRPSPFGDAKPRDINVVEEKGKDSQTLNVDLERRLAEESLKSETVSEGIAVAREATEQG